MLPNLTCLDLFQDSLPPSVNAIAHEFFDLTQIQTSSE